MPVDPGVQNRRIAKNKRPGDAAQNKAVLRDLPNSKLYLDHRELDLKIEQYSNRTKADICDVYQHSDLAVRCLRLQLYNRHYHQGSTDPACPPSWSFYISGHFVDHNQGTAAQAPAAVPVATPADAAPLLPPAPTAAPLATDPDRKKVSDRHWTSAMASIQLRIEDPDDPATPAEVIRWERNRHIGQHKEAIEVHRTGSKRMHIGVTMVRDFAPAYHLLTGALRDALGIPGGTRGHIARKLKAYALEHSTPLATDPSRLTPDATLRALLGTAEGAELDGPSPGDVDCYDVEVAWNLRPALLRVPPFLDPLNSGQQLEAHDAKIAEVLAAIKAAEDRRRTFMGFATDPAAFIRRVVAASAQEVRELDGQAVQTSSADHFKQPWAQEAAIQYLYGVEQREAAAAAARRAAGAVVAPVAGPAAGP